ncbi:hypothetical protein [Propionivibrio sp.]|uniref:hypothetical protein n=1 Tax=Propionivibrio sp. TaxID=2212460 RepID=UPI0025DFC49A|nr:hypothetical protein [Propionivibrio sp.]MBK7357127.1 hypothetical protein [Propionivibrio sp.]MBK8401460.1 hypothetical protein [Propionivibrio sp.]MBK8745382.1 hypothetical protein [Propionivibrio sp.]MBL0209239.1 hypothetical protein [Propionivibrio sp.]
MKPWIQHLPLIVTLTLSGAAIVHGPIAQLPDYHNFADQSLLFGIPHFADVISNLGFVLVALWGLARLAPCTRHESIANGWAGYRLFLIALLLTGVGSSYYHLAPDNARLVWDRLPIALACGGLLAGVWGDTRNRSSTVPSVLLAIAAVLSVGWWYVTEQAGAGDLRPYLLLQGLPLLLIPLWQWIHDRPRAERLAFTYALAIYALAKLAELGDHPIARATGMLSGHTLKHLLASAAAAFIVAALIRRIRQVPLGVKLPPTAASHSTFSTINKTTSH